MGRTETDRQMSQIHSGPGKAVVIILWFSGVKWNLINKRNVPHSPCAVLYKTDRAHKCPELGMCTHRHG